MSEQDDRAVPGILPALQTERMAAEKNREIERTNCWKRLFRRIIKGLLPSALPREESASAERNPFCRISLAINDLANAKKFRAGRVLVVENHEHAQRLTRE